MDRNLTQPITLDRIPKPAGCASAPPKLSPFVRSLLDEGGGNAVISTE